MFQPYIKTLFSFILISSPLYANYSTDELFELSLEDLMKIDVTPVASMTTTHDRKTPASVTLITQKQIQSSGARNLLEVMEIYVPNFHYLKHYWEPNHIGMRGIINDRDGKFLLLVNGRVLNEKTHFGAISERDLPMMGDISKIEVVRGTGSAIYGPGAVGGVISITTQSAKDFESTSAHLRVGTIESYQMLELKHAQKFSSNSGFYMYAAAANYEGASNSDSPVILGHTNTTTNGSQINAGEEAPYATPNDRSSARNIPLLKLHASYFYEDFDVWMRYTQGGENLAHSPRILTTRLEGFGDVIGIEADELATHSVEYSQLSTQAHLKQRISSNLKVDYYLSFDTLGYTRVLFNNIDNDSVAENHREDEYQARALLQYSIDTSNILALGVEYSYENWGLATHGYPESSANITVFSEDTPQWSTSIYSLYGEYQSQLSKNWTTFLGLRVDKHTFTNYMYSPRGSLVFTPNSKDTFKFIASQSLRMNFSEELKREYDASGSTSAPEKITTYELIYDRTFSNNLQTVLSSFYNDLEVITFGGGEDGLSSEKLGDVNSWGLEAEVLYASEKNELIFSHTYTKLIDFKLATADTSQAISAQPYGYGNDFTHWSNHITKFVFNHQYNRALSFSTSLRVFWDYPGVNASSSLANDAYEQREDDEFLQLEEIAVTDDSYNEPSKTSAFLNLGTQYNLLENCTLRFDAHNVLGWFEQSLNKRLYYVNVNSYRVEAPSFSIGMDYSF